MSNSNVTELARKGNPQAISALLNQSLQPFGVLAKALVKGNCLHILLEADPIPDQGEIVPLVTQEIAVLNLDAYPSLLVYGRQKGAKDPAWSETVDIASLAMDSYDDIPLYSPDEGLYMDEPLSDDLDEDASLEDAEAKPAKASKRSALAGKLPAIKPIYLLAIPVVLLAGLGAWWFLGRSSTPPAPTAAQVPAPATPVPPASASENPFGDAVRAATEAANSAQNAQSKAQWEAIATKWQQASDLMKAVPQDHPKFSVAQERVGTYQKNAEAARTRAANSP